MTKYDKYNLGDKLSDITRLPIEDMDDIRRAIWGLTDICEALLNNLPETED
jgi:hypothetical protein